MKWKNIGVLRCATIIKYQWGVVVPSIKCFYNALESRVKLWENLAPQCFGGASGDEESCVMMARLKEDSSDEEDCNSFEGDDSNNGESYDHGNDDA